MQPPIVKNGVLELTLYHGTSSLNLDLIKEHGLGGYDPVSALDVFSYAKEILDLGDKLLLNDHDWNLNSPLYELSVNQRISKSNNNFRHGKTYLTPSKFTASRYAFNNPYGSELLTTVKIMSDEVALKDDGRVSEIQQRYLKIIDRLKQNGTPIVIRLPELSVKMIKSETGNSPEEVIREIEGYMFKYDSQEMIDVLTQQCNFQLDGVVPHSSLAYYKVVKLNGQYKLTEIQ